MPAQSRAKALLGIAAGVTITALFASSLAMPAVAEPVSPDADAGTKIKLADTGGRLVVKDRYLVETRGTPLARGGNRTSVVAAKKAASAAVASAGAEVTSSHSRLWTGVAISATETELKKIAASPSVVAIYPVYQVAMPKPVASATRPTSGLAEIAAQAAGTGAGVRIGVIDTGVDYNHPDLGGGGINNQNADFPSARITVGYDFVGDDYDSSVSGSVKQPDALPDDCNGHGTHVAGIIGAAGDLDNGGAVGVATGATLGAYRIFGCDGSTDTAVILQALEMAAADDMDVVNMSLGSDFAIWPEYPDAVAASNLVASGVVVVAAAGNSGDTGLFSAGSPAGGKGLISVASYEAELIRIKAISTGGKKIAYTQVDRTAAAPADNASRLDIRIASSLTACKTLKPVPDRTALLIKRGTCDYRVKVAKAQAAGADAVIIYDSAADLGNYTAGAAYTIPAISISGTDGASLYSAINKLKAKTQPMTWLSLQSDVPNPGGGRISRFSSAGIAADLSLVPTISAPGGKVYSTLPLEDGGHGNLSGTSMATPFIAGSVALLLEAKPSLKGNPAGVAQLLYNSAVPASKATESGVTKHSEAVFRQGAGLVKLANAIGATVKASPSVLKLGEGTSDTVTVTLTNTGSQTLTYKPSAVTGVSAAPSTGSSSKAGNTTPNYGYGAVGFTPYTKSVTLAPNTSAQVKLKITAPSKVLKGKKGMLYGGWVEFTTTGAGNTVSVPFVGMRGDYQSVKLLNSFKLVDNDNKKWSLPRLGVESYGTGEDGIYFLGSTKANKYTFDLQNYYPAVIYHLDYPASDLRLKVINTKTKKSYYALIWDGPTPQASTHWDQQPRDADAQWIGFYGGYLTPSGSAALVPDGNYQLQLKVLKPLGTASKSSHWQTYTSPKFYIRT